MIRYQDRRARRLVGNAYVAMFTALPPTLAVLMYLATSGGRLGRVGYGLVTAIGILCLCGAAALLAARHLETGHQAQLALLDAADAEVEPVVTGPPNPPPFTYVPMPAPRPDPVPVAARRLPADDGFPVVSGPVVSDPTPVGPTPTAAAQVG